MRTTHRLWVAAGVLIAVSCSSGSPAGPSPSGPGLNIPSGAYVMSLIGFGISGNPEFPPCTPLGVPSTTGVDVRLNLVEDGPDWLGRSPAGEGTLEVRFRRTGDREFGGIPLAGTIRGSAPDAGIYNPPVPSDVEVVIEEPSGELAGHKDPASSFMLGRIFGVIKYRDSAGATATCSNVSWSLQPDWTGQ